MERHVGAAETKVCGLTPSSTAVSQSLDNVAPGCDARMLRIIGDGRLSLGSEESEHLTLRRPVDGQRLGPREARARERRRLPPFEDGTDDVRSKTAEPSEL